MSILWILAIPLMGSALLFFGARRLSLNVSGTIALLFSSATFALAVKNILSGLTPTRISLPWISDLGIKLSFYFDPLTAILLLVITSITTLAVLYSIGYFKKSGSFNAPAFYSLTLLFLSGMIGVVISSDLILFYFFWELMLLPSYAFVAYFGEDKARSSAIAIKYFIFTHIGAVLILAAILILFSATGSADIMQIRTTVTKLDPVLLKAVTAMFIIGFAVKMAIFPLHSWLPETYSNAPIPATILLSSVMINAPIYGFLRFFFTLLPRQSVMPFMLFMLTFALISQFYGAILAMSERNIKKIIAYSSVSQLGYVLFGIASFNALGERGAVFHIINHGIIKALLFMGVGAVIFATGKLSVENLGGLTAKLPFTALVSAVGALAIAGVPLFCAFQSEWLIFAGGLSGKYPVLAAIAVAGATFTAAYALLFLSRVFFGEAKQAAVKNIPFSMGIPMGLLALATLIIGICPWFFSKLVENAVKMLGVF